MPSSSLTILLNAASGSNDKVAIAKRLADLFEAAGLEPHVDVASGDRLAELAQNAIRDDHIIVAGGGDGTVSTIASVVAGTRAVLGVVPLGTLNHFAKDLQIPLDVDGAARTIIEGHTLRLDVGEVNGRSFINNSSLGVYPRLVWEREKQRREGRQKWLALAVAVMRVWMRYRRVRVALESGGQHRIIRTPFVFVGNNEYRLRGVTLGERATLSGGCLHLCMAPGLTRAEVAGVLLSALVGRLDQLTHFESVCASEFSIHARRHRLPVSLDGELTVMETPLRFHSRRGVLRVLVPASAGQHK